MNDRQETRWMVIFWHSEGSEADEHNFPKVEFWHPDRDTSLGEGERVLRELIARGDDRDWGAAGYPDPFHVGAGLHPGGQWILSISALKKGNDKAGTP